MHKIYSYFFDNYEKPTEGIVEIGKATLGDKNAMTADIAGMLWDSYSAVWLSDDRAIFVGSLGFANYPDALMERGDPLEEIGPAPYKDNETINKILSSFVIFDNFIEGVGN